jgi:DNA processing protein
VTSVDDVLELATGMAGDASHPEFDLGLDAASDRRPPDQVRVLDALSARSARTTTDVARRTGMSMGATEGVLGLLALDGLAVEGEAGWKKQKR